ncbi:MAG: hypothetical protein AAF244_00305 [Pseudomonadota bacterium]
MIQEKQAGNILVFILIAILLIGLLTISLTRSNNSTNETGNYELQQITISNFMRYAKNLEIGIQMLKSRGCGENEISFDNPVEDGYENLEAPDDFSCHIFEAEGAGLEWQEPDRKISRLPYAIYGDHVIHGIGSTSEPFVNANADLILVMRDIPAQLCEAINLHLDNGLTSVPIDRGDSISDGTERKFIGEFTADEDISGDQGTDICSEDVDTALCGITSGCFKEGAGEEFNVFYSVLYAR